MRKNVLTTCSIATCSITTCSICSRVGRGPLVGSSTASGGTADGGSNLVLSDIGNKQVLGDDASNLVVCVVAGVASAGVVVRVTRGESAGLDGQVGVGTDGSELRSDIQGDLLVARGLGGGRVLVLGDGSDLGVLRSLVAEDRGKADLAGVSLEGPEHDSIGLSIDIASRLRVGESLVGDDLLKTIEVRDVGSSLGSGSVAEKGEDSILNLKGVVQLEVGVDILEDGLVRVLLRNLTLGHARSHVRVGHVPSSSEARKGDNSNLVLHF